MSEQLAQADFLHRNGRVEEAMRICNEILNEKADTPEALFMVGKCLIESGKHGLAHALFMQFLRLRPNIGAGWNNLGRCYHSMNMLDEAERCFRRAMKIDPEDSVAQSNLGLIHLYRGEPEKAIEHSEKAVKLNPDTRTAKHNLGLAYLMKGRWKEGWANYEASIGYDADRRERAYGDEPRWDGSKGKTVIAYGEQGIGDELSFASCLPDFIKDCSEAVVECDERLVNLFRRSFPEASVYGTRYKDVIDWGNSHTLEGRIAFGSLPGLYRNSDEDFPGTPYLVADPERRLQWRALLDSLGPKIKVGISWQGGSKKTGKERRSLALEQMLPILRQNATFISLQYKGAAEEVKLLDEKYGITVHHWPRAVEAKDYDETAALVAELDVVVSVTTAVIHLAGALGVPCLVLTPKNPRWFYGLQGKSVPWYNSVELIRQKKDWAGPINDAAVRLRDFNGDHQLHESRGSIARVA